VRSPELKDLASRLAARHLLSDPVVVAEQRKKRNYAGGWGRGCVGGGGWETVSGRWVFPGGGEGSACSLECFRSCSSSSSSSSSISHVAVVRQQQSAAGAAAAVCGCVLTGTSSRVATDVAFGLCGNITRSLLLPVCCLVGLVCVCCRLLDAHCNQ
jgi:hypothetical protein